jgi:hypothetical protein
LEKRAAGSASQCLKHQRMEAASAGIGFVLVWDKLKSDFSCKFCVLKI